MMPARLTVSKDKRPSTLKGDWKGNTYIHIYTHKYVYVYIYTHVYTYPYMYAYFKEHGRNYYIVIRYIVGLM